MSPSRSEHGTSGLGLASWYTAGRIDGFGDRLLMFDNSGAASLELLRFRPELAAEPGFEDLLRQRVQRLSTFRHPSFATIRTVEHLEGGAGLALVSNHTAGKRLADLLDAGRPAGGLHPAFVSWLVQHITPLLAALQAHGYDIVHGALTADRIVLTAEGRVAIVEHALGSALRGLEWSPNRLWREFGIVARPTSRGEACLDARGDILQLGVVALSLLIGRRVTLQDVQEQLPARLDEFSALPIARDSLFSAPLRQWLERALQTHPQSYRSAAEAQEGLRELPAQTVSSTPALLNSMMPADDDLGAAIEPPAIVTSSRVGSDDSAGGAAIEADFSSQPVTAAPAPPDAGVAQVPSSAVRTKTASILDLSPLLPPPAADIERTYDQTREVASMSESRPGPTALSTQSTPRATAPSQQRRWLVAGLALVTVAEAAVIAVMATRRPDTPVAAAAIAPLAVTVEAAQPGTAVFINDQAVGTTPLSITLDGSTRSIRLAGGTTTAAVSPAAARGADVAASAVARPAAPRPRSGSVRFTSPIQLQVFEGSQAVGSTSDGAITLSAGTHQLELVNTELGFRSRQSVTIRAGETEAFTVTTPMGRLSLNAQPWAQVLVDQTAVGETPIANLAVPIGQHEVTFRHPQLGERRETVTVRADGVTRVSTAFGR